VAALNALTATALGMEEMGARPIPEGAASVVWAATLPDDGPTGGFFRDRSPCPGEHARTRLDARRTEWGDPGPADAVRPGERIHPRDRGAPGLPPGPGHEPSYVGLWTRLRGFRREDLTRLTEGV
jgi:hypothetical protein